jgi:hypothetical protein
MSDLLQKFGVKELRDFQQESVDNLLEGKDVYLSIKTSGETQVSMESIKTSGDTQVSMESIKTSGETQVSMESIKTSGETNVYKRFDPRVMEREKRIGINRGLPTMVFHLTF